jgi:hypothetical protein
MPDIFAKRIEAIRQIRQNTSRLKQKVLDDCIQTIYESYDKSSLAGKIGTISLIEKDQIDDKFRSIGIRRLINLMEFNDETYIWKPYFSDVARAIANGEKKYIQDEIQKLIKPSDSLIQETSPDFRQITQQLEMLLAKDIRADTLIAPIYMLPSIYKQFASQMVFESSKPEILILGGIKLRIFWSNKYAPIDSFIMFNAESGKWLFAIDPDTKKPLIVALGESATYLGKVEYWVETFSEYCILDPNAFAIVPVNKMAEDSRPK